MPLNLVIGTERAAALQQAIQDELINRGYSTDADPVMAEYITIMMINNKTPTQITTELEDLIGGDFNPSFTAWLFAKATEDSSDGEAALIEGAGAGSVQEPATPSDATSQTASDSRPTTTASATATTTPAQGRALYQQTISQAIPTTSTSQKRTASARSPSPHHPNKTRRTDLPTGPRAMQREGGGRTSGSRLLDRISDAPHRPGPRNNNFQRDEIQARIDNITANAGPDPSMMQQPMFPGMPGMEMNMPPAEYQAMTVLAAQYLLSQMPAAAMFGPPFGFDGFQQPNPAVANQLPPNTQNRGRGGGRGGGRPSRGRGGAFAATNGQGASAPGPADNTPAPVPTIASPTPVVAKSTSSSSSIPSSSQPLPYAVPERPQSPTLCKFGLKCTNAHCRYSHPSPVATVESGMVLSNEACENGKECKDKDCVKAHVSPATLKPAEHRPAPQHSYAYQPQPTHAAPIPCRFGAACTRPGCTFNHPPRITLNNTPCRFGTACTRATCQFQHPEGRVLPSSFHRGLSTSGGLVNVPTPETGSMGGPSPHKSVTFNSTNPSKEELEQKLKDLQAKKDETEKAMKEAQSKQAAANAKKGESKSVSIAA